LEWPTIYEGRPTTTTHPVAANNTPPSTPASTPSEASTPWRLCLDHHYSTSPNGKASRTSFDIDSICAFPTSLAVARHGISWLPQQYPTLSLTSSVHLGLKVSQLNSRDIEVKVWRPLHQTRYYYFSKIKGMPLLLYFFFPQYNFIRGLDSTGSKRNGSGNSSGVSTLLRRDNEVIFTDEILLPTLHKVTQDPNILLYYPKSAAAIKVNSKASGSE
jgi:hypothetical protein